MVREVDRVTGLLRSPFCPDSDVVNEFYIEGTEPIQQCAGQFGAAPDSARPAAAAPAPFGQPGEVVNTVRPHAAPVPKPATPPRDSAVPTHFDPFHPGKP